MTIEIKCPVCDTANTLAPRALTCEKCAEDLSLLYQVKGYAYKYRLYLLQTLQDYPEQRQQFASSAQWLSKEIIKETTKITEPVYEEE